MKKNTFILTIILILALALTACSAGIAVKPADSADQPAQSETPAPQSEAPQPAWSLDPDSVTDSFAADTLIRLPELRKRKPLQP